MAELSHSAVVRQAAQSPAVAGSDLDSEDGRAFVQTRIALFAKTAGLVSLVFLIADAVLLSVGHEHTWATCWDKPAWHSVAVAAAFVTWALMLRRAWSARALAAFDAGFTLISLIAYGLMSVAGRREDLARVDLIMSLASIVVLMLRAVIVPSRPLRTGVITAIGMLPASVVCYHVASNYTFTGLPGPAVANLFSGLWTLATVSMTTLISHTIYNLRARVQAAQRLGQYLLDEKIGEGGMGAVYKARHAFLRRPTAVKLILPERAGKTAIARFEREVQMTAMLTHPNTVNVFDYGHTPDGVFYYAMEYLEGIDLERLVAEFGPQPPERVVHLLQQVCGALAEAHANGLVHRDVKPANIILCERGRQLDTAKIVDFGLVKSLTGEGRGDAALSNVDAIVGTPLYLAPEALLSPDQVDARSDLYALGAVAYFLLTGSPVFEGASVMEVCAKHLHSEPEPLSSRRKHPLPAALERLILRCLAKKPAQRPPSADALAAELAALDVEAWTQEQARAWWAEHGGRIEPRRARRSPSSAVPTALTIDVEARAAPG